ncbi:MAG: 3-isopropylmalate dehydratase small subunit [Candidatus Methylarchaceae archaeon HK02M2]|nr:3-isopropylmalate dehydratase small subunit [Candidatus Methylarchaceae archaeon HK02M2]
MEGRAWKFGDNINTDIIIPYKYKARTIDPKSLANHCMEGIDPKFSKKVRKGDFIVAGKNFGCGSSREQAPVAIKACGISAVIAESFARIFYRNAINIGLPVIAHKDFPKIINEGDTIEVDLKKGVIKNLTKKKIIRVEKQPKFLEKMLQAGGLVEYYKKFRKFPW